MKEIRGNARSIRDLLQREKYAIDYYQREFNWGRKQVSDLIEDLCAKFLEDYDEAHERSDVRDYGHYFMGSIIISQRDGKRFIVDGQQRLTTLTLLLIYLRNIQKGRDSGDRDDDVKCLICSIIYGEYEFNLDVPSRKPCMEALFEGKPFDADGEDPSVRNIAVRFEDLDELFPDALRNKALPFFVDWLTRHVHLVEITAFSDDDAYTIFETMNDRGLSLTPTDMLKGFLLANIKEADRRTRASDVWKEKVQALKELGKDEDADCLKAWLRSRFADTIREPRPGAAPRDFDRIGTEFHRWVRENKERLGLAGSDDFSMFIERDFGFYARQYMKMKKAAETPTPGIESIHYNAQHNFTLQYPLIMAPLEPSDDDGAIMRKTAIVSDFVDILIARRVWSWRAISYATLRHYIFGLMKEIRGLAPGELADALTDRLADLEKESPAFETAFDLNKRNGKQVRRVLARMTDHVETGSGSPSRYREYSEFEIEHIWADHPERHEDDFDHPADFQRHRNRIGGLLLLPKSFNASYGDLPYDEKLPHYLKQNLLARSLHEKCYEHEPGFARFVKESGAPFKAHPEFRRRDLDERQALYQWLARRIWDPGRLKREAGG